MIPRISEKTGRTVIDTLRTNVYSWLGFDGDRKIPNPGLVLFLIICLALVMRILNVATASCIDLDGIIYADMGDAFSRGAFREGLKGVFPPFYPLLIGLAHLIVPDLEMAGVIISLIAGLLLVYLAFSFFRTMLGDAPALYGALFVAINPYLVRYSASALSESVATLLVLVTVFLFFKGWTEDSRKYIMASGFFLSLTYLTRPEYVVYVAPLSGLLLAKKRFLHFFLFFVSFAVLTGAYIYWMKLETGLLVLSKKAILAKGHASRTNVYHSYLFPVVSLSRALKRIHFIFYDLLNGILPQFVFLAVLGVSRTEKRYRLLVGILVLFHMLPMAVTSAFSKRLYVELMPLLLPLMAGGLFAFRSFTGRFRYGKITYYAVFGIIVGLSLFQGINLPDEGRALNKKAGLYLLAHDPHRIVASRLPITAFYARGEWDYLPYHEKDASTCPAIMAHMKEKGVGYAVVDEKVEKENPFIANCLKPMTPVAAYGTGEEFLKLYRIPSAP